MRRSLIVALTLALLAAGCSGDDAGTTSTTTPPTTTTSTTATTTTTTAATTTTIPGAQPRPLAPFGDLTYVALAVTGEYPGPPLPVSLDEVSRPEWLDLEPEVAARLLENGFVVVPADYRQFQHAYASHLYEGQTFFVTTDAAYHFLHLAFSKVLRELEQTVLLPILEEFVANSLTAARAQTAELAGTQLAEPAARVEQMFQAAAVLLELDAGDVGPLAEAEVELALEAARLIESPTTSYQPCRPDVSAANCVDYSLFKPRGHYTRTPELERYFRAMSLLGQSSFFVTDAESLRLGLLMARVVTTDPALAERWSLVYEPTAFLVGLADDYTPFELAAVAEQVAPGVMADPAPLADPAEVDRIGTALAATREVGINPEAAAVRIMGARFVVDSFIYDQLLWPNVGEEFPLDARRVRSSPLDLAAAFGSGLAYRLQDEAGETDFLNYEEQLTEMAALLAARTAAEWAATVYDAWLYALEPMFAERGDAFPAFMRTEAWAAKSLQAAFGSYAELKHDTILYAKQAFAAEGGFEPPRVPPRHWVEPDPVAFERMEAVAALLAEGLERRGLLPADQQELLDELTAMLDRFGRIARDELAGLPISEEDNEWLEAIGPVLEAMWVRTADWDPELGMPSADDVDAAVIADIARSTFYYEEIGTGRIDTIYVLVPDDAGRFQVAGGGVYSYYEFWWPEENGRLTDQEWRAMLDGGEAPPRPAWQEAFLAAR